ncbi:hypothetical protein MBLNU230_g5952t1 [Neophaeotheca triangularis]
MNSYLLNRQIGSISHQAFATAQNDRLLRLIQAAPGVRFSRHKPASDDDADGEDITPRRPKDLAHAAGVSSICVDRFEGRYLLSAGADSSIAIWDLETPSSVRRGEAYHVPFAHATRTSTTESLGITGISFYPFDSLAFLTSGYDHTVKLFSSETLEASATFDIGAVVHSHATSGAGSHLLVACASQHPSVRLIDLRSGASTHSLAGHAGSVLTVAWHPRNENILASGGTDGTVRLWDVRRSASSLGLLDMEDSIGIAGFDGRGTGARRREGGKAHNGVVNGIAWSDDGSNIVSVGHDERMRVWDMHTGANTLANFGPSLKNTHTSALVPLVAPTNISAPGRQVVYYPNPKEILASDLHEGNLFSRLRAPGTGTASAARGSNAGVLNLRNRTTSLAWRAHNVEMYSSHADGTIRCWRPRTREDAVAEQEEDIEKTEATEEGAERKRKREDLDQIVRDLTGKKVTFS